MPTYEYRCPRGHEFEVFQRITSEPGAPCPECGEPAERQLSSGAGLLFKGSGFYITDYRSESYRKSADKEKPASKSEGGGKSESGAKPDSGTRDAGKGSSGGGSSSGSDKGSSGTSSGASSPKSGD